MTRRTLAFLACALGCPAGAAARDPFLPPPTPLGTIGAPLQRLEIAQLTLVALVCDLPVPRALLEDPDGIGYIAIPGTPVGRNGGRVVAIERRKLHIREPGADHEIALELQAERGGDR